MPPRARLDAELVRRGIFASREQAGAAVAAGRVLVRGQIATKPATVVGPDAPIALVDPDRVEWASRGAYKLLGALRRFGVPDPSVPDPAGAQRTAPDPLRGPRLRIAGRRCLDAGASTGGFTDVLLRAGAAEVVAVDVGYGQIVWRLRTDPRVRVLDRTNVRSLKPDDLGGPVELVVADLSFISLPVVLPALVGCTEPSADPPADFVLLVKPQFEVGRERVGKGGVVRDPALRADAVRGVAAAAAGQGLGVRGLCPSPLPGPAGNVEYVLWLATGAPALDEDELQREITREVSAPTGPGMRGS